VPAGSIGARGSETGALGERSDLGSSRFCDELGRVIGVSGTTMAGELSEACPIRVAAVEEAVAGSMMPTLINATAGIVALILRNGNLIVWT
jgi:hypothetical protein